MAQDFERHIARATGTSGATIFTADGDDAIVSLRLTNIHSGTIVVDCFVTTGGNDYYLIKQVSIPTGSSLELIDGGSRFVLASGDALKVDTDTASSLDTWCSVVGDIST
tara:strand:- start:752 stop:1078 length:327 start_codon:yes stop_codon:yes gene_type:complete